jgi:hypothetical protein
MTFKATEHPLYNSYRHIQQAIYNPNCINYPQAGALGLTMDWNDSPSFIADIEAHLGPKPAGMKLARKDHTKGWTLKNLTYSPSYEVGARLDRTVWIRYQGENRPLKEWSKILGISLWTLRRRYKQGQKPKDILRKGPR